MEGREGGKTEHLFITHSILKQTEVEEVLNLNVKRKSNIIFQ